MVDQRLVHAHPEQRHQAERDNDGVPVVAREPRRGIGDACQHTQQRDLVSRRLLVDQDQMPQQGQGAQAVVRQPQHDGGPRYLAPAQPVLAVAGADDAQSELLGKVRQLRQRDLVHGALGVGWAQPQADRDASLGRQQRRKLPHAR